MSLAKPTKKTLVIALALLVVAAGIFAYLEKSRRTDLVKKPSTVQNQKAEKKVAEEKKQEYLDNTPPTTTNKDGEMISQTNYTPPTSSDNISLTAKRDGNNVIVTTQLKGFSDGKCLLTVSGPGSFSQEADVMYQPDYATCAGFSIPVNSVGNGTWQINLKVMSGGITNEKAISYEVN